MRRSQSQAIPTTTPSPNEESGLSSRAGSNWTLAEGGFPRRMPSTRPKKRKAPPPPPPVSVAATAPPSETGETNVTGTEVPSNTAPALVTGETTTTSDVTVETKPEKLLESCDEIRTKQQEADTGNSEEVVLRVRHLADEQAAEGRSNGDRVAPLAQGEDTAAYEGDSTGDTSRQSEEVRLEVSKQEEVPSLEATVAALNETKQNDDVITTGDSKISEDHVSSETEVSPALETESKDAPQLKPADETNKVSSEDAKRETMNTTTVSEVTVLRSATNEEDSVKSSTMETPEEQQSVKSPVVLTVTVQVNQNAIEPAIKDTLTVQDAKEIPGNQEETVQTITESQSGEQITSVISQIATEPDQSIRENSDRPVVDAEEEPVTTQDGPKKSALESFREEYLAEHYKRSLPVLQITESDLADAKDESTSPRNDGDLALTKLHSTLPVLHISEEDLRDPPAAKSNDETSKSVEDTKDAEVDENHVSQNTTTRRSLDSSGFERKQPPQPPTRNSAGQELNSKIYFRVLPPLDRGDGTPKLKTFASPSSPPGHRVKPEPPVRNGIAATHQNDVTASVPGDASPPRTKSPLPTPRRRHQQTTSPISDA